MTIHRCLIRPAGLLILLSGLSAVVRADDFAKGIYSATAGDVKWSIKYDDKSRTKVSRNGEIVVERTYKVRGDELELIDEKGPMACGREQPGKYKWKLDGKKLTLTKVTDECEGRANALPSQVWVRE